jgi:zinc protease
MNRHALSLSLAALVALSCRSAPTPTPTPPPTPVVEADAGAPAPAAPVVRASVPEPGPARDVHLPAIRRTALANGMEVNFVAYNTLPVLHLRLTVRAGSSSDPANLPGLSAATGDMLKEGTRTKTSAQIAETIEFVGGSISVITTSDVTTLSVSVLKEHAETALSLLAEVVTAPTFPQSEITKYKNRERDRLTRSQNDPGWLMGRAFAQAIYGEAHPYGHIDTNADALQRMTRADMVRYHTQRYVAGNMHLVVVGDVAPAQLDPLLTRTLGRVRRGTAPAVTFPAVPAPTARQVILVDRPNSAQSAVRVGNLGMRRQDDDWVPFTVTNQLLGGGVASRLFMDLRELRSLTYGAYTRAGGNVQPGTWFAGAAVRTAVTGDALHALMAHVGCVTTDAPPDDELAQTRSFLIDSFPLRVESAGNIADLVNDLRVYGLSDDYYDRFRTRVQGTDGAAALAVAQRQVHPDRAVVVVVGTADAPVSVGPACAALRTLPQDATFAQQIQACATPREGDPPRATQPLKEVLRAFGPVRVTSLAGATVEQLPALTEPAAPPIRLRCSEITTPALQGVAHGGPPAAGH